MPLDAPPPPSAPATTQKPPRQPKPATLATLKPTHQLVKDIVDAGGVLERDVSLDETNYKHLVSIINRRQLAPDDQQIILVDWLNPSRVDLRLSGTTGDWKTGTADDIETMLRHVFQSYTEGAQGTAVGILLGLELGRRGASPRVLREVATKRLGYESVETFRKWPEYNAIAYFADLLQRLAVDANSQRPADVNKIDRIMSLITELTIPEYWELTRRVRQLFAAGFQTS